MQKALVAVWGTFTATSSNYPASVLAILLLRRIPGLQEQMASLMKSSFLGQASSVRVGLPTSLLWMFD